MLSMLVDLLRILVLYYPLTFIFIFTNGGFLDAQSRDASQPVHYHRDGMMGFCWKLSRIGERLSPFVGASCLIMAVYVLFK
jgi:hypothetical protein